MKLQLDKALSLVALGVLGVLNSAHAAPVYEIVNIDSYDLQGTLEGTRSGYALGVNANDELVGISKGKKKLSSSDVEGGVIDIADGIAPEETITYSIEKAIIANNFTFVAAAPFCAATKAKLLAMMAFSIEYVMVSSGAIPSATSMTPPSTSELLSFFLPFEIPTN